MSTGSGAVIAAYHYLIQWMPDLDATACAVDNPCTAVFVRQFGFVSIPFMALSGFLAIAVLLWLSGPDERVRASRRLPDSLGSRADLPDAHRRRGRSDRGRRPRGLAPGRGAGSPVPPKPLAVLGTVVGQAHPAAPQSSLVTSPPPPPPRR